MPFQKGHIGFSKGQKRGPMSLEHRKKIGIANKGRIFSNEHKQKIGLKSSGRLCSDDTRKKLSDSLKNAYAKNIHRLISMPKEKNPNWKGGKTEASKSIRNSREYTLWRTAIFIRDNFTCIWCGRRGEKIHADHIKPFALFPELRLAIDNGRTLCIPCHKTTKTFGRKKNKKTII